MVWDIWPGAVINDSCFNSFSLQKSSSQLHRDWPSIHCKTSGV